MKTVEEILEKARTPEQIGIDIGEELMESGIGIGVWGDMDKRLKKAAEMEAAAWERAYRELYDLLKAE